MYSFEMDQLFRLLALHCELLAPLFMLRLRIGSGAVCLARLLYDEDLFSFFTYCFLFYLRVLMLFFVLILHEPEQDKTIIFKY